LGQGLVNRGIVLVEWSSCSNNNNNTNNNNKLLKPATQIKYKAQAVQAFTSVQQCTQTIRNVIATTTTTTTTAMDNTQNTDDETIMADTIQADQLQSLACQWMGVALWSSSSQSSQQQKAAIEMLEHAASFFEKREEYYNAIRNRPSGCLLQQRQLLELGAECIYTVSTLTDFLCTAMESLVVHNIITTTTITTATTTQASLQTKKGDNYLEIVQRSLNQYASIRNAMEQLAASVNQQIISLKEEYGIASPKGIKQTSTAIQLWCHQQDCKNPQNNSANTRLGDSRSTPRVDWSRSDLGGGGGNQPSPAKAPTARIIVGAISCKR
jgi:hypothetical protein